MIRKTTRLIIRLAGFVISSFLLVAVILILVKATADRDGPDLEWWHSEKINLEFDISDASVVKTLDQYLAREEVVFDELQVLVESNAPLQENNYLNRYRTGNDAYPEKPTGNLNRSNQMRPAVVKGGVLLLHGMTDSPYTLRHLATMFHAKGFYVLNLRLPGHGTIPAELDRLEWQDWQAAVKLGAKHVANQLVVAALILLSCAAIVFLHSDSQMAVERIFECALAHQKYFDWIDCVICVIHIGS